MVLASRAKSTYKTTLPPVIRILLLIALPLAICSSGSAASLYGQVTEVVDGESMVVVSVKHVVKVKLMAVAAPEKDQSYAGVARQHLADLILNKFVVVRYSALRDGYLVGQVMAGDMDVGAQMLRDGVGWYDKSEEKRLSEAEQRIYAESQAAARDERRGLWQEASPVSPWDHRQAQAQIVAATPSSVSLPPPARAVRPAKKAGLSSEDLMGGAIGPGSIAGKPEIRSISPGATAGGWVKYQPADRHFSILAPSDGREITYPVLDEQGNMLDFHYLVGSNGGTLYFVMWTKAANGSSTDTLAADQGIKGILIGINRQTERHGFVVTAGTGRSLRFSGYAGKQYALSGGPITGVVRILSKQIGDERKVLMLCVFNGPDGEGSGSEFLNSLKIKP